jgi:serine/threonine-protein kinase
VETPAVEPSGQLDRYKLLEKLGTGGMSVVYRGWDTALDREVAVKLLHPHLAEDPESRRRFSREARAVAKLHHPNILEIYDFSGESAPTAYIVTEFIRGVTLRRFADDHSFGPPALGALAAHTLTAAVEHAHQLGIVHRDIKPENAMVREDGVLKLMDFGIARMIGQGDRMTVTGALVGSPAHMAPEIIEGRSGDTRSDIFSLGTLLYWLTTGVLPFTAGNTSAVLKRVLDGDSADPRTLKPELSDALAGCIRDAMARDPERRIQTATELRERLEEALREDGLEHPAEELTRFFRDPSGYRERFEEALPGRLTELARSTARRGEVARTLSLVNRILVLDPGNTAAARLLKTLRTRTRIRQVARGAVLTALAVAAGLAVSHAFPPRPKLEPLATAVPPAAAITLPAPEPAPAPAPPPPAQASPAPERPSLPRHAAHPRPPPVAPTLAVAPIKPAGEAETSTLSLTIRPWADVFVDGSKMAKGVPSVQLALAPGQHQLALSHPDCKPLRETINLRPGENQRLRLELEPMPARLRIRAVPGGAGVMVDSVFLGLADDSKVTPIPVDMANQQTRRVMVRVFKDGFLDKELPVTLSANHEVPLDVVLTRE